MGGIMGTANTKDNDDAISSENNMNIINTSDYYQHPKLQKRSFLLKFEQDYMNPIFGGPEPVISNWLTVYN